MADSNLVVVYIGIAQAAVTVLAIVGALHVTRVNEHIARLRGLRGELAVKVGITATRYHSRRKLWTDLRDYWTTRVKAVYEVRARGAHEIEVPETRDWDISVKTDERMMAAEVYDTHLSARLSLLSIVQPNYGALPEQVEPEHAGVFAAKLRSVLGETSGRLRALLEEDIQTFEEIAAETARLKGSAVTGSDFYLLLLLSFVSLSGIAAPLVMINLSAGVEYDIASIVVLSVFGVGIAALNAYFWAQLRASRELIVLNWPGADAQTKRRNASF